MEINMWIALSMVPGVLSIFHKLTADYHHHHHCYHHHHHRHHHHHHHHHNEGKWPERIKNSAKVIQLISGGMARKEGSFLTPSSSGHTLTMLSLAAGAENNAQQRWILPWLSGGWVLCWTIAPEDGLHSSLPSFLSSKSVFFRLIILKLIFESDS